MTYDYYYLCKMEVEVVRTETSCRWSDCGHHLRSLAGLKSPSAAEELQSVYVKSCKPAAGNMGQASSQLGLNNCKN